MKKKKGIVDPKFIYDDLFQTNIYVSYGVSPEYLVKQIDKCLGIKYPIEDLQDAIGKHIVFGNKENNEIIWIWTKLPKLDILVHELIHTAVRTLTVAGIQINNYTDEILAYYMQYLTRKLDLLEGEK